MAAKLWKSWNGLITHPYENLAKPSTSDELFSIVKDAPSLRVLGTGKSSADICAGTHTLIDLSGLDNTPVLDESRTRVWVGAACQLSELIAFLARSGLGFPALPDLDAITVAGAIATGTHGTGRVALSLSDYVEAIELVDANGTLLTIDRGHDVELMDAAAVSLGLFGVSLRLCFRVEPLFDLQVTERPSPDNEWSAHWREDLEQHDFLRVLWLPHTGWGYRISGDKVVANQSGTSAAGLAGSSPNPFSLKAPPRHHRYRRDVSSLFYRNTWRLPSSTVVANRLIAGLFFGSTVRRLGSLYETTVTKSRSTTLELAEWTVSFDRFDACFAELRRAFGGFGSRGFAHIPMDVRFIRSSSAWLSNAYGYDTVTVGCVSRYPPKADEHVAFKVIEEVFLAYGGRPHWAKRFSSGRETLQGLYPRYQDFVELRRRLDPSGKFLNSRLAQWFS